MTGLEPAGGWTVRVTSIAAKAVPTAKAMLHQSGPRNLRNPKPIKEQRTWPTIRLRGCENTASGNPNSKTQEAPKEPNIQGWPES